MVDIFAGHCSTALITVELNFLDHIQEGPCRFGSLFFLDNSSFEHCHVPTKRSYCRPKRSMKTRIKEIVRCHISCSKGDKMAETYTGSPHGSMSADSVCFEWFARCRTSSCTK